MLCSPGVAPSLLVCSPFVSVFISQLLCSFLPPLLLYGLDLYSISLYFLSSLHSLLPIKCAHSLVTAMLLKEEEGQLDKSLGILQPCSLPALFPVLLCLMPTCACSPPPHPFTDWSPYSLKFSLPPIILPLFLPPFLSVTSPMSLVKMKSHLSRSKPLPKNQLPFPFPRCLPSLYLIWVTNTLSGAGISSLWDPGSLLQL